MICAARRRDYKCQYVPVRRVCPVISGVKINVRWGHWRRMRALGNACVVWIGGWYSCVDESAQ